jgi:Mg2+/Co2+ transporter CorB
VLSALFSGSETALMSLNRYRLLHLVKHNNKGAKLAHALLQRPDRLIGLILLGNNFINIFASSIATIIAIRVYGESGIAIAAGLLTFVILIFSEVAPKTMAALHPERVAFPASIIYTPLLKLLYPLVWLINTISNKLLKLLGVDIDKVPHNHLEHEELRTVVTEAGALIPQQHQTMLLGILDLEKANVEDIMTPIHEIHGINISDDFDEIRKQLLNSPYSHLPVFETNVDNIHGFLRIKDATKLLVHTDIDRDELSELTQEPYFIPNNTSLYQQLINFQQKKQRFAVVVDEYGVIVGLITLQDVLEEVIGEFTTDPSDSSPDIQKMADESLLINGNITIREINRTLKWSLPTDGPKTLNGLILEYLEAIPEPGTSLKLYKHPIEIIQMEENAVKLIKYRGHSSSKPR